MKPQEYLQKLNEGAWLVLPSGLEVRVKPTTSEILLAKSYPGDLMRLVHDHIYGTGGKKKTDQEVENDLFDQQKVVDAQKSTMTWLRVIAENVVIDPVLVDKPQEECEGDEFPIRALVWEDLTFMAELVNMPLARLYPFCREQALAMEPVLKGESQFPRAVIGDQFAFDAAESGAEGFVSTAAEPEMAASAVSVDERTDNAVRMVDNLPV